MYVAGRCQLSSACCSSAHSAHQHVLPQLLQWTLLCAAALQGVALMCRYVPSSDRVCDCCSQAVLVTACVTVPRLCQESGRPGGMFL